VNTVLSTRVDKQNDHHPPSPRGAAPRPRHISVADRAALHLGLALITWSRRPHAAVPELNRDDLHARHERAAARADRERLWLLAMYLSQPRR
jgi:hypothetical protein